MKVMLLIISALMAAIGVAVAAENATQLEPHLAITLSADAPDVLAANGIWAPNLTAFAQGEPNTAGVDPVAEAEKLIASDIDVKDLVRLNEVSIIAGKEQNCDRCNTCQKACAAMLALWFFCAAGCFSQSYCDGCSNIHLGG